MKALSGRDTANVMPNSGREEQRVVTTSFEHSAEKKNTFHEFSLTDGTWEHDPHQGCESPILRTLFDRQSDAHHQDLFLKNFGSLNEEFE